MRSIIFKKLHTFQKFLHHWQLGLYFCCPFYYGASSKNGEMRLFKQCFLTQVKILTQK